MWFVPPVLCREQSPISEENPPAVVADASRAQLLMIDGFVDILTACAGDGSSRTSCVRQQIQAICGGTDFSDDFSLLEVEFP